MSGRLKKLTEAQALECVEMYERGMSLAPISAYFGVSRQAMWDLLRRRTTMRARMKTGADNHFHRGGETQDDMAHNMVEDAIKRGVLVRAASCSTCGSGGRFRDGRTSIQAHHADYNKPLDVSWLCQRCHHAWHRDHRAVPRRTA